MEKFTSLFFLLLVSVGAAALFRFLLARATGGYRKMDYSIALIGGHYIITVRDGEREIPADQCLRAYRKEMDWNLFRTLEENYPTRASAEAALIRFRIAIGQATL